MRSWVFVLLPAVLACQSAPPPREFDGVRALERVEAQVAFGPRVPGTAGHRAMGEWLVAELTETVDTVVVQDFLHETASGDTVAMRNVIGQFRPGAARRIMLLAHWDTRPRADQSRNLAEQRQPVPGANDGASGVALLLGVADVLGESPPDMGVDLLFVDGEDYGDFSRDQDVLIGSRYYAQHPLEGPLPEFAVLFDMVGDSDLEIFKEGNSVLAAPDVVDRVWGIARSIGYGDYFRDNVRHTVTDDHVSLHRIGVKAINIIDFDYSAWHTVEDDVDRVSAESLQVVGDVAVAIIRS